MDRTEGDAQHKAFPRGLTLIKAHHIPEGRGWLGWGWVSLEGRPLWSDANGPEQAIKGATGDHKGPHPTQLHSRPYGYEGASLLVAICEGILWEGREEVSGYHFQCFRFGIDAVCLALLHVVLFENEDFQALTVV